MAGAKARDSAYGLYEPRCRLYSCTPMRLRCMWSRGKRLLWRSSRRRRLRAAPQVSLSDWSRDCVVGLLAQSPTSAADILFLIAWRPSLVATGICNAPREHDRTALGVNNRAQKGMVGTKDRRRRNIRIRKPEAQFCCGGRRRFCALFIHLQ